MLTDGIENVYAFGSSQSFLFLFFYIFNHTPVSASRRREKSINIGGPPCRLRERFAHELQRRTFPTTSEGIRTHDYGRSRGESRHKLFNIRYHFFFYTEFSKYCLVTENLRKVETVFAAVAYRILSIIIL